CRLRSRPGGPRGDEIEAGMVLRVVVGHYHGDVGLCFQGGDGIQEPRQAARPAEGGNADDSVTHRRCASLHAPAASCRSGLSFLPRIPPSEATDPKASISASVAAMETAADQADSRAMALNSPAACNSTPSGVRTDRAAMMAAHSNPAVAASA